ncbi:MAG: inorganic pyrophosphatase [Ignavibacteriae bacterium]|nr:inorganic pyrophosphatase [Ignavibacteriota bacterium]
MEKELAKIWGEIRSILKAHPWHGVNIGENCPEIVTSYIEIVPTDTVKYEIDKNSGILTIDRPQMYSNICPTPYGFIPQTYCGEKVAEYCREKAGRDAIKGDGDPLDICVLTEKVINMGNILLKAIPIGGLRMIDNNEADDKIIAVMKGDSVYGNWKDISDCPEQLIDRLKHYFLTYKEAPGKHRKEVEITHVYNKEEAQEIVRRSYDDYISLYGNINELLKAGR